MGHMHHLADSMTKILELNCVTVGSRTVQVVRASQCMIALWEKLYVQLFVEVEICLYARGWMNLDTQMLTTEGKSHDGHSL